MNSGHRLSLTPHTTNGYTRFLVESSDVIEDMRVNVLGEQSRELIWYKERFLADDEIIEHIVFAPSNTIQWSIHRPKRGWYIRLRSPQFPPGVFLPLLPVLQTSPHYVEGSLSFSSRTNITTPPILSPSEDQANPFNTFQDDASQITIHSYPPTPPPVLSSTSTIRPPSPTAVHAKLDQVQRRESTPKKSTESDVPAPTASPTNPRRNTNKPPPRTQTQITQFILSPHSYQPTHAPPNSSFLSKALSVFKNIRPSHSNSFTLTRLPATPKPPFSTAATSSPPPPYPSSSASQAPSSPEAAVPALSTAMLPTLVTPQPLLVFHDRTPVLTMGSVNGLLEINRSQEMLLGVDTGFWIAVALVYLDYLEEREGYFAAMSD